jgi:hypothetical protein
MLLDAAIAIAEVVWLATEDEKIAFFSLMAPSFQPARLPHLTVGKPPSGRVRLFPDGLPIGVEANGRAVFLYLARTFCDNDLRALFDDMPTCSARCPDGRCGCSCSDGPAGSWGRSKPLFVTS